MSVRHIGLVLDHLDAKPALKLVALILADHADSDGICLPSYRRIAERSGLDKRTVRRHIGELQSRSIITKIRTGTVVSLEEGSSQRISNAYQINADVLASSPSLLSTGKLWTTVDPVPLEVDKRDHHRGTVATPKSSLNHQANRQLLEAVHIYDPAGWLRHG